MNDVDELIGLWDSGPYDYGSMESSRLALLPDGSGWTEWANAGQGMSLALLRWERLDAGQFSLTATHRFSGRWDPERPGVIVCPGPPRLLRDETRFRYELRQETPPLGNEPVESLRLDRPLEFAQEFALVQRDVTETDRPVVTPR